TAPFGVDAEVETAARRGRLLSILQDWAAYLRLQLPGHEKHAVTDHLGFDAALLEMPEPAVVGVAGKLCGGLGPRPGLHAIGVAGDDKAVQVAHAPAGVHELDREPVQKFRM